MTYPSRTYVSAMTLDGWDTGAATGVVTGVATGVATGGEVGGTETGVPESSRAPISSAEY